MRPLITVGLSFQIIIRGTNLGYAGVKVMVKRATTILEDEATEMDINNSIESKQATAV
jgi:hypothetical protein